MMAAVKKTKKALRRTSKPSKPKKRVKVVKKVARITKPKKKSVSKKVSPKRKKTTRKWSQPVTEHSHALDLETGVFTWEDPSKIARSLRRSAETSTRRKAPPYQSALSMLNFYINRAGKQLSPQHKKILVVAKSKLKSLYGKA